MTREWATANKHFSALLEEMQMEDDYLNELLMLAATGDDRAVRLTSN